MKRRSFLSVPALGLTNGLSLAQPSFSYPTKPVRLIVPFPVGGGTDLLTRLIASKLTETQQWRVMVDNRAGDKGGTVGVTEAVKAAPTGYDLLIGQKDNLVLAPWLYRSVHYNPTKDLIPIASIAYTPVVIATRAHSPFKVIEDVVKVSKKNPASITYASPGNGTTSHLSAEIFSTGALIKLQHIPYKGSNAAMLDVLSGHVDLLVSSVPSALTQIKAKQLLPLAVTSEVRSSSLPHVPTLMELGYPSVNITTWYGLFAPHNTPPEVTNILHQSLRQLLERPDVKAGILEQGAEPMNTTREAFARLLATEYELWRIIVQRSGVSLG